MVVTIAVSGFVAGVRRILSVYPLGFFGGSVVHCGMVMTFDWGFLEIVVDELGAEWVKNRRFREADGHSDRT